MKIPEILLVETFHNPGLLAAVGRDINNLAAFPGMFKGALEAAATRFTGCMLVAAAQALAKRAGPEELQQISWLLKRIVQ